MENIQTIIATEQDGVTVRTLVIHCEILSKDPDFDLRKAVEAAVKDYIHTPEGKRTYEYNCGNFNWADFEADVPNELCEKHDFRKIDTMLSDLNVNWDEQLVDEFHYQEFWGIEII